ncbi:hypothetical protein CP98_00001 [Sphingobium yanoikuyae]|uniref:Uncharacterized protein n=1 Tax=Sphingobium yanoikuyae TaxID=13690 RepID=A0A084ETN2_SPHYA|nr:hypothetical protein [Sphingobium yanoikuyae]KEZ21324.1 hypothetical protein CP98_00001 [Sphingobium yanoikuyae]
MDATANVTDIPVIYKILGMSSDEQLAPLVDTLTQTPLSILKICRAYERHAPDHSRYTDQIGDEVYRLGQKALNVTDGSRPSYQRMIGALCKQLGLPAQDGDLAGNETTLLNLFTSQRLSSIAADKQQAAVNEARQAVAEGVRSFFGAAEWPALAASLMQIAFLRGTYNEFARASKGGKEASSTPPPDGHSDALVISNDSGTPVLTLAQISFSDSDDGWRKVSKDDTGISRLNSVLQAVPGVATAVEVGTSNYMNVIVPAGTELVESVKHGGLIGTLRKIGTSEFAGAAKLDIGKLSALAASGAALNIASAMLAQKHLADISEKLSDIKEAVEDVAAFQKNERRSVLTGSICYYEQIAGSVLSGELSDEVVHVIEMHETKLLEVQNHLAIDIRSQTEALKILKDEEWVRQGKYIKALDEQQAALDKLYHEMLLCLRARAFGWQLLSVFPSREKRKEDRLQDIRASVLALLPQGEVAIALDQLLREKIKTVTSAADRSQILRNENALMNRISAQSAMIFDSLETIGTDISTHDRPLSMDLKIQDGIIIATRMR